MSNKKGPVKGLFYLCCIPVIIQDTAFRFTSLPRSYPVKLRISLLGVFAYIHNLATSYWGDKIKNCTLKGHRYILYFSQGSEISLLGEKVAQRSLSILEMILLI